MGGKSEVSGAIMNGEGGTGGGGGGGGERWKDKKNFPSTALARSVIT